MQGEMWNFPFGRQTGFAINICAMIINTHCSAVHFFAPDRPSHPALQSHKKSVSLEACTSEAMRISMPRPSQIIWSACVHQLFDFRWGFALESRRRDVVEYRADMGFAVLRQEEEEEEIISRNECHSSVEEWETRKTNKQQQQNWIFSNMKNSFAHSHTRESRKINS